MAIKSEIKSTESHPVVELFKMYIPILNAIMDFLGDNQVISEHICECFVEVMTTCTQHTLPLIYDMLLKIVTIYEKTKYSCYLWVFNNCIKFYFNEDNKDECQFLKNVYQKLSEITLTIPINDILETPEIVEEFFNLSKQIIEESAFIYSELPIITEILQFSLNCLEIDDLRATCEIIDFYKELYKIYDQYTSYIDSLAILKNILGEFIRPLIYKIFEKLILLSSLDVLPEICFVIIEIYNVFPDELIEVFSENLSCNNYELSYQKMDEILYTFKK